MHLKVAELKEKPTTFCKGKKNMIFGQARNLKRYSNILR